MEAMVESCSARSSVSERDARHFEEEIEQLGALAEAKSGTARGGHGWISTAAASTI